MSPPPPWVPLFRRIWTDEKFLALSCSARLLFVWTWTNDRAGPSGLYRPSAAEGARVVASTSRVASPPEALGFALAELRRAELVRFDDATGLLWVVNRARYVEEQRPSRAMRQRMLREYEAAPPSPVKTAFRSRYRGELALWRSA